MFSAAGNKPCADEYHSQIELYLDLNITLLSDVPCKSLVHIALSWEVAVKRNTEITGKVHLYL